MLENEKIKQNADYCVLGYNAVKSGTCLPRFRNNILAASSGCGENGRDIGAERPDALS
jgi:hypothetical protein